MWVHPISQFRITGLLVVPSAFRQGLVIMTDERVQGFKRSVPCSREEGMIKPAGRKAGTTNLFRRQGGACPAGPLPAQGKLILHLQ